MWRSSKKELGAVICVFAVLVIWNAVNISKIRTLRAQEKNLKTEQDKIKNVLNTDREKLFRSYIYIDKAIDLQKRITQKLKSILGDKFRDSVFTLPEEYRPGENESKKVFYAGLSTDVRAKLIKKMNLHGMKVKVGLNFGKPDEDAMEDNISMIYLIEQVLNDAVESGLKSLESIRQQPREVTATEDGRFTFVFYRVNMGFTGNAVNILSFIDRFQDPNRGKETIFLENIRIDQNEGAAALSMDFILISFKGESKSLKADGQKADRQKKDKPETKENRNTNIKPIGI